MRTNIRVDGGAVLVHYYIGTCTSLAAGVKSKFVGAWHSRCIVCHIAILLVYAAALAVLVPRGFERSS